jgi:hypothetical protein
MKFMSLFALVKRCRLRFFNNDGYRGENNLSLLILDVVLEYALRKDNCGCVVHGQLCSVHTLFIC